MIFSKQDESKCHDIVVFNEHDIWFLSFSLHMSQACSLKKWQIGI